MSRVPLLHFRTNDPWLNAALLGAAAAAVWFSGVRLSRVVDEIVRRTGLGEAFAGFLLLGTVTSLPEIVTTVTGATIGNASLVTGNLYGGVAAQTCVIAVADLLATREALTHRVGKSVLILQAAFLVLLMIGGALAWSAGEPVRWRNVGLGSALVFAAFLVCLRATHRYEREEAWRPVSAEIERRAQDQATAAEARPVRRLYAYVAGLAAVIMAAGYVLTRSADALAEQLDIGSSVMGATLVAITTSLPEISTTVSAARVGAYTLAISNIFGGNLFDAALVFPADALYREGVLLAELPRETLYLSLVASVMTLIYVWGLLERRNRTVLRMGVDSLLVLCFYAVGISGLYLLRSE